MKRLLLFLLVMILLLSVTACSGYNGIMRDHLCSADNYHDIEATFCSYEEADDRIYLYVSVKDKSAFDVSEKNREEIRLALVGDNRNALRKFLAAEAMHRGDRITIKCSTWIYMDSTFYYVAELKTQSQTLLPFTDGLKNIMKYVNDNKSIF